MKRTKWIALSIGLILGAGGARSEESLPDVMVRTRLAAADLLAGQGKHESAIYAYETLDGRVRDAALRGVVLFNHGCALLTVDRAEEAAELLRRADRDGGWGVRADARYNLGHALVHIAEKPQESGQKDPVGGLRAQAAALSKGERAFRSALDVDPTHAPAGRNVERLRRRVRDLLDQADAMEEQMKRMQEQADRLDELSEQQKQQGDKSQSANASTQQQQGNEQQGLEGQTKEVSDRLREMSEQARKDGNGALGDRLEEAAEQLEEAQEAQQEAQDRLRGEEPQSAGEPQQEAADQIREASEMLREASEQPSPGEGEHPGDGQDGQQAGEQDQPGQEGEGDDPGDKVAKQLLEREQRQREARQTRRARLAQPRPVERDW